MVRVYSVDCIPIYIIRAILTASTRRCGVRCHASFIVAQRGTGEHMKKKIK